MKQLIRGFSIGLFTATLIAGIVYLLEDNTTATSSEKIEFLQDSGYYIYEEDMSQKVNSLEEQLALKEESETEPSAAEEESNGQSGAEEANYQTISIEPGMTLTDIVNILTEEQIISDEEAFIRYLEENELSRYIQVGEFTLHDQMDIEEAASILTGQNQNED